MKTTLRILCSLILLAAFAACNQATGTDEPDSTETPQQDATLDATAIAEAVAATVSAELTQNALDNPSPTPDPDPTETKMPTQQPTLAATATPTVDPQALPNHALFVTDVTVPDGTVFVAGEPFTKTWRLQNIGSNAWTTEYSVVFVNGDIMNGFPINFSEEVPSGAIVDITISMVAPPEAGTYTGYWMLADPDDVIFGIGPFANQAFLVAIEVVEPTPAPTATATSAPTQTPNPTQTPTP